jgi:hypothetical protein
MYLPPATAEMPVEPGPPQPARPRPFRAWYAPRTLALTAAIVTTLYFGPGLLRRLPDLTDRPEYLVATEQIQLNQPPRWIPSSFVAQVAQGGQLPPDLKLLSPTLMEDVRAAFLLHPWVDEVVSITARSPAGLSVRLKYRHPVAMVETAQGLYPIDANSVLLPPDDFSVNDAREFPIVGGVRSTPQGPAGTAWGDPVVLGAARLADALASRWKPLGLERIECPRVTNGGSAAPISGEALLPAGTYGLVSRGSLIVWGRATTELVAGELSLEQKLGRLDKYHTDFGGFDKPHGPYLIDIRHWQEISRRPLGPLPEARRR